MLRELLASLRNQHLPAVVVRPPRASKTPFPHKKVYVAPAMRRLDPEIAKLILLANTWEGDRSARKLLELIFSEGGDKILPPTER